MFFIPGHVLMGCGSAGSVGASGLSHATLLGSSGIKLGSSPGAQCLLLRPGPVLERQQQGAKHLQHLSAAPGSRSPPREGAGPHGHHPGRATSGCPCRAGSRLAALSQGEEQPKKGSNQTEILCMVNCLHFLPRSPGRAASLLSPAPFSVKRKGDDETCCFFSCCAYKSSSLLRAGGGGRCPSSSSVAGWGWRLEPETSLSSFASPR